MTLHIRDDAGQSVPQLAADAATRVRRFLRAIANLRNADTASLSLDIGRTVQEQLQLANLDAAPYRMIGQAYAAFIQIPAGATRCVAGLFLPAAASSVLVIDRLEITNEVGGGAAGAGGECGLAMTNRVTDNVGGGSFAEVTPLEQPGTLPVFGGSGYARAAGYPRVPPVSIQADNGGAPPVYKTIGTYDGGRSILDTLAGAVLYPGMAALIVNSIVGGTDTLTAMIRFRQWPLGDLLADY